MAAAFINFSAYQNKENQTTKPVDEKLMNHYLALRYRTWGLLYLHDLQKQLEQAAGKSEEELRKLKEKPLNDFTKGVYLNALKYGPESIEMTAEYYDLAMIFLTINKPNAFDGKDTDLHAKANGIKFFGLVRPFETKGFLNCSRLSTFGSKFSKENSRSQKIPSKRSPCSWGKSTFTEAETTSHSLLVFYRKSQPLKTSMTFLNASDT